MGKRGIYLSVDLIGNINSFNPKRIAQLVVADNLMNELVKFCLDKDHLISSRAACVLGYCFEVDKKMVIPYFDKLIDNLKNEHLHNGVIRNTLRLFQKHPVPQKKESQMLDMCYGYINDSGEAIAVRAFAMTVIYNISLPYPELLLELKGVLIHINHPEESAGIKSRIKNTLNQIEKLSKKNHKLLS
jgi:hypothetical protein